MTELAEQIAHWHKQSGRHDLPWQYQGAYATWISEIMLQQTQVAVVIPYFLRFMESFPNPTALADADLDTVLGHWAGLGYYARARNLHAAAIQIRDEYAGRLPETLDELMSLKGIGRSTAGAILSLGLNKRGIIQDGNVRRVLARYFALEGDLTTAAGQRQLWDLATNLTPIHGKAAAIHNQAMMDLGATVCRRTQPSCIDCPLASECQARITGRIAELPQPKKVKQRDMAHWVVLQAINDSGEILLHRRPAKGIWGGLFAPPIGDSLIALGKSLKIDEVLEAEESAVIDHAFSHFRVRLNLYRIDLASREAPSGYSWVSLKGFQGGLPAPIEKLLIRK